MRNRHDNPLAEAEVNHTSGLAIVRNTFRGPATILLTLSALESAMRLGTNSPTTMLRYDTASVIRTGARPGAMNVSQSITKLENQPANGAERFVDAAADAANPTSVIATWIVARKLLESLASASARRARRSPSSASFCSMTCLAFTNAISDIEK